MTRAAPTIGSHLAVLNLFREADGTVEITVADARGAMAEPACRSNAGRPIDYVEALIVEAAARIEERRVRARRAALARSRGHRDGIAMGPSTDNPLGG